MTLKERHFARIHDGFTASISEAYDCGRICAPLNEGEPVCCSTQNAIPVVEKSEYQLLRARTKMWRKFKPYDAASREIVDELADTCTAIECKGAAQCERKHRTLACRAFPFYPYFTKEREIVGLSYYWIFEDRCWVISHLDIIEQPFIDQILEAYAVVFKHDEAEEDAFFDHSANMRRVFSRQNRAIPVITPQRELLKVLPKSGGKLVQAEWQEFPKLGPFTDDKVYREAIEEAGGEPDNKTLSPDWSIKNWWDYD